MKKIIKKIKKIFIWLNNTINTNVYRQYYRVIKIINEDDVYKVHIQIINSSKTFFMNPEEILADDDLVTHFSPLDVRTLTYLGYLGINSPKYKILANRIAEQGDLIFVIKQKGSSDVVFKTSKEIITDLNLLKNMSSQDISSIAYNELEQKNTRGDWNAQNK